MKKREYCESHETIAYYSGLNGLEIKGIEYGIEDYVYCVSGAWAAEKVFTVAKFIIQQTKEKVHSLRYTVTECRLMSVSEWTYKTKQSKRAQTPVCNGWRRCTDDDTPERS